MKSKLIVTLTLLSIFGFDAPAAVNPGPTATTNLQVGHYYRIRNVNSGRYMCFDKRYRGDDFTIGDRSSTTKGRKQPIIFIQKDKALTSPGTIFKLTSKSTTSGVYKFVCQGEDVNNYMNGKSVGYSGGHNTSVGTVYNGGIYTNNVFDVTPISATSYEMTIRTKSGYDGWLIESLYDGYFQDEADASTDASYLSISITQGSATCQFYFEEVTGESDAYLGLPLKDPNGKKTYSITYSIPNGGGTETVEDTYGISDTKHNTVDDSYYTSACFSFPVVVPNDVLCFFMNNKNEAVPVEFVIQRPSPLSVDGYKVMPAATPFIVQTPTNDPSLYKFYPLYPGHFAQDIPPTNLNENKLIKARTNFVAKARTTNDYVGFLQWEQVGNSVDGKLLLAVDGNGKVHYPQTPTLGDNELTDGNRAYYGQKSDPIELEPTEAELVDLIYEKENGSDKYTEKDFVSISDELVVGYVNNTAGYIFAHDKQNNKDYPNIQPIKQTPSNYFNFKPEGTVIYPDNYYQSNWVAIYAPNELSKFTKEHIIPSKTLIGNISSSKDNPVFYLLSAPDGTPDVDTNHAIENTYSVAHLAAHNHELVAHSADHDGESFWFMQPRAMEVATIVWAVLKYDEASGAIYAYVPKHKGNENSHCFKGKVSLNPMFYDGELPTKEQLQAWDGQAFSFRAVIIKGIGAKASSMTRAVGDPYDVEETEVSQDYIICPLSITEDDITTAIDEKIIDSLLNKVATSVRYYNLQGIESSKPFDGVNIVVINYNDGSRSTMKMIK